MKIKKDNSVEFTTDEVSLILTGLTFYKDAGHLFNEETEKTKKLLSDLYELYGLTPKD